MSVIPAISTVEPGGVLRYRGHDVGELVRTRPYGEVWTLLVDGTLHGQPLPPAESFPLPVRTGDHRVDLQAALAALAPVWGFLPITDVDGVRLRSDLARACSMAYSFLAQSARSADLPSIGRREIVGAGGLAERFLMTWRGEVSEGDARALNACWVALAEHGLATSTRAARLIAGTGADAAACLSGAVAASSGPIGGGATARSLGLIEAAEHRGDARAAVRAAFEAGTLFGFGNSGYTGADPRVTALRRVATDLGVRRLEVATAVAEAARAEYADRDLPVPVDRGDQVMFWSALLFDHARVPARMFTAMFACARLAGWSAHVAQVHEHRTAPGPGMIGT
ncbi:citrate/2-methylcitrate synthase [Occultella glacieicola]|nr:citrate/2-methylcitrate synthase [Occultella glacieicola]